MLKGRVCLWVAALVALSIQAQDTRGRVQGTITDPSGAAVPGVSVMLTNDATGISATRETATTGRYLFDQVDTGLYTVTAKHASFSAVVQKNVRVQQRGDVTVDFGLKVSDVSQTVTVDSSPVAIQFNTADRTTTVDSSLFKELPLTSRNPATLAALDPSVNGDWTRNANFDHYAANAYDLGGRTLGRNEVLIDGSPLANSAKLGYNPPVEAVGEYAVRQNAIDAEFGHSAGGVITMSMKSGTNELHGSAYYFGGNPGWNAVSNRITRQHSKATSWNGGLTVGMPIIKNKLFMFSAFEKQTDNSYITSNYTLPTALERQGDFSQSLFTDRRQRVIYDPLTSRIQGSQVVRDPFAGNMIPGQRFDSVATTILKNLWAPNNAGDDATGLNNYKFEELQPYKYFNLSNRVDWQINDNWKTFGRVSLFRTTQDSTDYTNGADVLKMRRTTGSIRNGLNIAGDTVYTLSPTAAVTFRGSYYKTEDRRAYPQMDIGQEGYSALWPNKWWTPYVGERPILYFPNIQVPSGDTFGVRNFWWQQPLGYSFSGQFSKYFEKHSLKIGGETRLKRGWAARFNSIANLTFNAGNTANSNAGALVNTGAPWASFLLGALDPSASSAQFVPVQKSNTEMYAVYIQDDFKVNRKLTLNLGLRYEYEGGIWDPENRLPQQLDLTDPIPGLQAAIDPLISADIKSKMAESARQKTFAYNGAFSFTEDGRNRQTASDKFQFMPRAGLAYRLGDKTAIRIGYGRFYTPNTSTDNGNEPLGSLNLAAFSPTTDGLPTLTGVPQAFLSNPFPQGLTPVYGKQYGRYTNLGDNITLSEYQRRPPISDRINFSVQREIWGKTILDVTFFKNFVSRDLLTLNLNQMDPRLSYKYGAELSRTVANPFFNYGAVSTFPGALRRQATVSVATLLRPFPQYGNITQNFTDLGKFTNQTAQIRLQRAFQGGYSFMASYAYVTANSQVFYDEHDQYDGKLIQVTDPNSTHRFVGVGAYAIPIGRGHAVGANMHRALDALVGGWQLSGIYTYRNGQLLQFGSMVAPQEVKQLGGTGTSDRWFDITGFSRLPAFTRRANPLYYDSLRGPVFNNVDAVLSKKFSIHERIKPEFRLEAYNALNRLNWANPNTNITASDFGRTNAAVAGNLGRQLR
ncbi:MAG: carboxypeptidase regulatory-like domain-containing protein, partial [Bryobacteraceae bacterium]